MPWQPLLTGSLAECARDAVNAIADDLPNHSPLVDLPADRIHLSGGAAGIALFHGYLGDWDRAGALLNQAIEEVADMALHPSLFTGWGGVAWAAAHLGGGDGDDDPNREIDARMLDHLRGPRATKAWDLITGLTGIAVYALERRGRPLADDMLAMYVHHIEQLAVELPTGLTLFSPPVEGSPEGSYNAGVAHGVPGVLGVLGSFEGATRLRRGFTAWLRSILRPAADGSQLPYWIDLRTPDHRDPSCRAAWCYGDPGAAAALLRAARLTHDRELEALALHIGLAAAARTRETNQMDDAGLCHGSAGLLHLFNRLYQATHEERFRTAAITWTEHTLEQRGHNGVAGFAAMRSTGQAPDPGLLYGAAGIGLALLAATSDVEPRWDAILVADVPPLDATPP